MGLTLWSTGYGIVSSNIWFPGGASSDCYLARFLEKQSTVLQSTIIFTEVSRHVQHACQCRSARLRVQPQQENESAFVLEVAALTSR